MSSPGLTGFSLACVKHLDQTPFKMIIPGSMVLTQTETLFTKFTGSFTIRFWMFGRSHHKIKLKFIQTVTAAMIKMSREVFGSITSITPFHVAFPIAEDPV